MRLPVALHSSLLACSKSQELQLSCLTLLPQGTPRPTHLLKAQVPASSFNYGSSFQ